MRVEYECVVCGKHVVKKRSPANVLSPPKYCSQKCHGIDRAGKTTGEKAPRIEFSCEHCGKFVRVYRSKSQIERSKPRFCSIRCLGESQVGINNPSYTGGNHVLHTGYRVILMPDHPKCDNRGYVLEHRHVAEKMIGRYLDDGECVHHIDGDKLNNSPENLEVFTSHSEHMKHHMEERNEK